MDFLARASLITFQVRLSRLISAIDGWPMLSILLSIVIGVLLTTPMAWISRRFIEEPFVAMSRKWRDRRREVFTTT